MPSAHQARAGKAGRWQKWTRTQAEVEAEELLLENASAKKDSTRIDSCSPGSEVTVRGMVRSMTLRPKSTVPALEIELYDGSGSVRVVWLGRRRIPGIEPGRSMVVTGRLTCNTKCPTIYNPRYELKPVTA